MIWTPSPRPPWSEWLTNLTLRDATAFMAHLSPVAPPLALSPRRRRDDVEGKAPWSPTRQSLPDLRAGRPPKQTIRSSGAQDGGQGRGTGREGTWRDGSASRRERGRGGAPLRERMVAEGPPSRSPAPPASSTHPKRRCCGSG